MTNLQPYYATDRRIYNGAPCSDMRRQWNREEEILKELRRLEPRAWMTYFPQEGFWSAAYWDKDDKFCDIPTPDFGCKQTAMLAAIEYLEERNQTDENKH